MPELPELHLSSSFVNAVGSQHVFSGKVFKSPVHKSADVSFSSTRYTITSHVRGKEMSLTLTPQDSAKSQSMRLLFHMGMSGQFHFTKRNDLHKHAHLSFFTADKPIMALSFVDVRRFGGWQVKQEGWGHDRGPDPIDEHEEFRKRIEESLGKPLFAKPICEVIMDQRYFNGIGNYLRAEILFRTKVRPFDSARSVLEPLLRKSDEHGGEEDKSTNSRKTTRQAQSSRDSKAGRNADLLQLCRDVPMEVMNLGRKHRRHAPGLGDGLFPDPFGTGYTSDKEEQIAAFESWVKCYAQSGMRNMVDHNGRTIWFKGDPGPLAPKAQRSRGQRKRKLVVDKNERKALKSQAYKRTRKTVGETDKKAFRKDRSYKRTKKS